MENNTISGGHVAHVGQLYFDQDLVDEIEKLAPYNTNSQLQTTNKQDFIFSGASYGGWDPVLEYALLGDSLQDGIICMD